MVKRLSLARWLCLIVLIALTETPALAQPAQQADAWLPRAGAAIDTLGREWGEGANWRGAGAWQRFVIVDVLADYAQTAHTRRLDRVIGAAVRNRAGLALNDDRLWAVIATVHVWQRDPDPALLAYAASTYRAVTGAYWDDGCRGGLWWDPARTYKNAITNELLLYASTRLFLATGQDAYRQWALRTWEWLSGSTMITPDGLVNDGLDGACHNNGQPRYTYNQGVLIGGLADLARITGDPRYRAAAVQTALAAKGALSTPAGILREPVAIGADGLMFKGIFAYHLGHLIVDLPPGPERAELSAWARRNAEAVWRDGAGATTPIPADWTDPSSATGAAPQAAGIAIMLAAAR